MVDYFALLNEPRRPWIEVEELKTKFHSLSSEVHPDRTHNAPAAEQLVAQNRYTDLNAAYQCLREPKDRLLHLLTLERGTKPQDIQRIPAEAMELFAEVGQLCQKTDKFLAEKATVTSPLLKVQIFERGMEWSDQLSALQAKVNEKREQMNQELKTLNAIWMVAPAVGSSERQVTLPLERLEQIYRALSFVTRWNGQLQERIVQLSF